MRILWGSSWDGWIRRIRWVEVESGGGKLVMMWDWINHPRANKVESKGAGTRAIGNNHA